MSTPTRSRATSIAAECHFLLKVVVPNRRALERLLVERLSTIAGVARIQTSIVLSEVKNTTVIPIEP